jgi:hypothetical protein
MREGSSTVVRPPEGSGWAPQGPYGLQRFSEGAQGRLLRLSEVLDWMGHTLEWPRQKALYAVFSHLVQLDRDEALHRRLALYVINSEGYALPLEVGTKLNPKLRDFWGKLSYNHPGADSHGFVYEIAELWRESWPGFAQHNDQFYRDGWVAFCKQAKAAAVSREGAVQGEEEYRTRHHLTLEEWKQRCTKAVFLLGRVAVPFALAHELWSWGTVVEEAAASPFPLADWSALVLFRNANRGLDWGQGNQIAVALTELGQRKASGQTESNALDAMAKEMGLGGRESLRKPLKLAPTDRKRVRKAESVAATEPRITSVRDGRKAA